MRHRKSGRKLHRTSAHRRAMFRNMCCSLIEHEIIKTTLPKAKELRRVIEPLITLAKEDSVAHRRLAFSRLCHKPAVTKLFEEVGVRSAKRPGGYVRIMKCGFRPGDHAPMAYVELVDREGAEVEVEAPEQKKAKKAPKKSESKPADKAGDKAKPESAKDKADGVEKSPAPKEAEKPAKVQEPTEATETDVKGAESSKASQEVPSLKDGEETTAS